MLKHQATLNHQVDGRAITIECKTQNRQKLEPTIIASRKGLFAPELKLTIMTHCEMGKKMTHFCWDQKTPELSGVGLGRPSLPSSKKTKNMVSPGNTSFPPGIDKTKIHKIQKGMKNDKNRNGGHKY